MTSAPIQLLAGEYLLIDAAVPGQAPVTIGVLLYLPDTGQAHLRLRRDWDAVAPPDEVDDLRDIAESLGDELARRGAEPFLAFLEDSFSNTLRISERESVAVDSPDRALQRLYRKHVETTVQPFRTHLPLYAARAAAGSFSAAQDVDQADWVEVPPDVRLAPNMFVAQVAGRSMEPLIPDGSWCVFRGEVTGSRQGRLVLVEDRSASGEGQRYTIKRYRSQKSVNEESWQHERITLEPLNPEYEAWDLEPDGRYAVIGEYVAILE